MNGERIVAALCLDCMCDPFCRCSCHKAKNEAFVEAFRLLYAFQWWDSMPEAEQYQHVKRIAEFCNATEPLARDLGRHDGFEPTGDE